MSGKRRISLNHEIGLAHPDDVLGRFRPVRGIVGTMNAGNDMKIGQESTTENELILTMSLGPPRGYCADHELSVWGDRQFWVPGAPPLFAVAIDQSRYDRVVPRAAPFLTSREHERTATFRLRLAMKDNTSWSGVTAIAKSDPAGRAVAVADIPRTRLTAAWA